MGFSGIGQTKNEKQSKSKP